MSLRRSFANGFLTEVGWWCTAACSVGVLLWFLLAPPGQDSADVLVHSGADHSQLAWAARDGLESNGEAVTNPMPQRPQRRHSRHPSMVPAQLVDALQNAAHGLTCEEKQAAMEQVCTQWAESDPAGAIAAVDTYRFEPTAESLMGNIIQRWASSDLDAAEEWGLRYKGCARILLISRLALMESQRQPDEAAAMVADDLPPGDVQDEAAIAVVHQWALHDLDGASTWVASFATSTLRERAFKEIDGVEAYRTMDLSH